jgi:uncharacterized membrane protein YagU involved in acid resistance
MCDDPKRINFDLTQTQEEHAMNISFSNTLIGGFTTTLVMTMMMQFVTPLMIEQAMDIAAMLGNMMGNNYIISMAAHLMLGTLVFPFIYVLLVYRLLPGSPLIKGLIWGFLLWLLAETLVMPMAGVGFFMSDIGGMQAVVAALMGHLVYGGVLGVIVSNIGNCCSLHQHRT